MLSRLRTGLSVVNNDSNSVFQYPHMRSKVIKKGFMNGKGIFEQIQHLKFKFNPFMGIIVSMDLRLQ